MSQCIIVQGPMVCFSVCGVESIYPRDPNPNACSSAVLYVRKTAEINQEHRGNSVPSVVPQQREISIDVDFLETCALV